MIPQNLRTLFWDVNIEKINPADHPEYVIGRVLELGDEHAVKWMKNTFSQADIKRVIANDGTLSRKSANFWALIYGLAPQGVAALRPGAGPTSGGYVAAGLTRQEESGGVNPPVRTRK